MKATLHVLPFFKTRLELFNSIQFFFLSLLLDEAKGAAVARESERVYYDSCPRVEMSLVKMQSPKKVPVLCNQCV